MADLLFVPYAFDLRLHTLTQRRVVDDRVGIRFNGKLWKYGLRHVRENVVGPKLGETLKVTALQDAHHIENYLLAS